MRTFSLGSLLALVACWDQILKSVYTNWTWVPWSVFGIIPFKWKWISSVQGCFQSSPSPLEKYQLNWRSLIKFLTWFFFFSVSLPTNHPQSINPLYFKRKPTKCKCANTENISNERLTMKIFFAANSLVLIYFSMKINYLECWRCLQRNVTEWLGNYRGKYMPNICAPLLNVDPST